MSSLIRPTAALTFALLLALGAPALLAYNAPPSATALNQLVALAGWGGVVLAVGGLAGSGRRIDLFSPLLWALALLVAAVAWSWAQGLPSSLALSHGGVLLGAMVVFAAASWAADDKAEAGLTFASAMVAVAGLSVVVAVLQVFANEQLDGGLVARSVIPGRAIGNLRQPNHLSTLLLWGLIALVPLVQAQRWFTWRLRPAAALVLGVALVFGVVLTASRTGAVGVGLLAIWGLVDRRLPRSVRAALLAAPVVFAVCWWGMGWWAQATQHFFGGQSRLEAADPSSSRFGIWSNTLGLIRAQPWTGVGWGEFNFAWTLSPFPTRPVAHFDHTHNLPLQLAVELGIPAAVLIMGLLLWSLGAAASRAWRDEQASGAVARACVVMVLMVGTHSLLEYPLWYVYFLYPTVWALGLALRACRQEQASTQPEWAEQMPSLIRLAGVLVVLAAGASLMDYSRVTSIFSATDTDLALPQRVERGMRSIFHSHHAYYAEATLSQEPALATKAFQQTTHSLLDARLMMAWARALDDSGEREKARYVADRLREFRNAEAGPFFAVCKQTPADGQELPFQCTPSSGRYTWRDFMPGQLKAQSATQ